MVKKIKALFRTIIMRYFLKIQRNFIRHAASENMSRIYAYLTLPTSQMFEYLVRIRDKTRTHGRTRDRAGWREQPDVRRVAGRKSTPQPYQKPVDHFGNVNKCKNPDTKDRLIDDCSGRIENLKPSLVRECSFDEGQCFVLFTSAAASLICPLMRRHLVK